MAHSYAKYLRISFLNNLAANVRCEAERAKTPEEADALDVAARYIEHAAKEVAK